MAGSYYEVEVRPSAKGWSARLEAEVGEPTRLIAERIKRQLSEAVRDALNGTGANPGRQGTETGSRYADAFARAVRGRLETALRSLPEIKLDANSSDVDRTIAKIREQIKGVSNDVRLGVDSKRVTADVEQLRAKLQRLAADSVDIRVRVNARAALAEVEAIQKSVDGRTVKLNVKADTARAAADLKLLQTALTLTPALIPLTAGLTAAATAAVGLAGAGGIALLGIKNNADKASTALVQSRLNALTPLVTEWERLGAIQVAPHIATALHGLEAGAPEVTQLMQELSGAVGDVIEGIGVGLPKALRLAEPLLLAGGDAASRFGKSLAEGPSADGGFARFLNYASTSLPETIDFLDHLASTLAHVLEAAAPVGGVTLELADGFVQLVSAVPTPALTALIATYSIYTISATTAALANRKLGASFGAVVGPVTAALAATVALTTALNNAQSGSNRGFGGVIAAAKNGVQGNVDPQSAIAGGQDPTQYGYQEFFSGGGGALALRDVLGLGNGLEKARGDALVLKASIDAVVPSARTLGDTVANIDISRAFGGTDLTGNVNQLKTGYSTITTALTGYLQAAQQLDGVGVGQQVTINKTSYALDEYSAAMARTGNNSAQAVALLEQNRQTASRLTSKLDDVTASQTRLNEAVGSAATAYHLTTDQVSLYAQAVGLSAADVAAGIIGTDQFSTALGTVADKLRNANTANSVWLDAVGKFNVDTATAADTAGLLAAALTASRGDTLDFATSLSSADVATKNIADTVKANLGAISDSGKLLGVSYVDASGKFVQAQGQFVDGSNAILGALSQQTQTATAAAAAQYQHDLSLSGGAVAAQNALTVYSSYRNELIEQLVQSGKTRDAANALADQYFAMPTDVSTFVKMLGQGDVSAAISSLTVAINNLSNVIAKPTVSLDDQASAKLLQIKTYMASINSKTITLSVQNSLNKTEAMLAASADGNIFSSVGHYAQGGIVDGIQAKLAASAQRFAAGSENHVPQIAMPNGGVRIWAEPETQGEAYIPFAMDRRARAESILGEVAKRFGMAVVRPSVSAASLSAMSSGGGSGRSDAAVLERLTAIESAIYTGASHVADRNDAAVNRTSRERSLAAANRLLG